MSLDQDRERPVYLFKGRCSGMRLQPYHGRWRFVLWGARPYDVQIGGRADGWVREAWEDNWSLGPIRQRRAGW